MSSAPLQPPVLGLLLAGGRARRMGGADKPLITLDGAPLIAHAIQRLAPQCAGLIINANGDPARFAGFGLAVIADDPPDFAGPLAGLLAGLEYARRARPDVADVATLPADTPFVPADLVARLVAARKQAAARVAVAASGGRRHHVVGLWPVALADALRRALIDEGERRAELFAERVGVAAANWDVEPFDPFFNINTPEDLARAAAMSAV